MHLQHERIRPRDLNVVCITSGVFIKETKRRDWPLQPATVCVWPYEEMYRDEVRKGTHYDAHKRKKYADEFFSKIEENSSLIFYYSNYSNPFSTDEEPRYALIGLSRVKEVGDDLFYDGCDERTLDRYGGYVWDRNVTSAYPEEGLRLPYHLYKDDPNIEPFVLLPDNPLLGKYGSKLLSDDEALGLVEQFHQSVLALIELGDTSENWDARDGIAVLVNRPLNAMPAQRGCVVRLADVSMPVAEATFEEQRQKVAGLEEE